MYTSCDTLLVHNIRGVPIHRYRPVSAIFASIGIGKMKPNLADTADTFINLYVKWKYTNYINIFTYHKFSFKIIFSFESNLLIFS